MNKLSLTLLIALACSSVHAQREYSSRDARGERRVDACVDDYTRGERVSRKQMKKLEEQCRRSSARSDDYRQERQLDRRRSSAPVTRPTGPQGRNLSDTSGAP